MPSSIVPTTRVQLSRARSRLVPNFAQSRTVPFPDPTNQIQHNPLGLGHGTGHGNHPIRNAPNAFSIIEPPEAIGNYRIKGFISNAPNVTPNELHFPNKLCKRLVHHQDRGHTIECLVKRLSLNSNQTVPPSDILYESFPITVRGDIKDLINLSHHISETIAFRRYLRVQRWEVAQKRHRPGMFNPKSCQFRIKNRPSLFDLSGKLRFLCRQCV